MKKMREETYEENFIKRFLGNERLKKEKEAMAAFLNRHVWWFVDSITRGSPHFKGSLSKLPKLLKKPLNKRNPCFKKFCSALKKAKTKKGLTQFRCSDNLNGFCLPVNQGSSIYGYIGLWHSGGEIPKKSLEFFSNFINILAENIQKDMELSKLYETIRPRAIALSTVHTIHRLISSTLDLNELLPRIARLCTQVVQSNRCSIKLLDKERNILIPVTTVDIRAKRKLRPKELKVGKGVPGKAVKSGKVLRTHDFLSVPLIDGEDVVGVITIYDKMNRKSFTRFDQEIIMTIAEQSVIAIKNAQLYGEQQNIAINSIKSLASLLDMKGPAVFIPKNAFIKIVLAVGEEMALNQMDLRSLHCAALLHDAGQIFVPDEILSKPSQLTGEEYALIKEHPAHGAKIFEPTKYLKPVIPIILHHHENYDGSGYPNSLAREQIPLGSRIMAVVGAFIAMITPRSYRVSRTIEEAKEEIRQNSGTQFDPRVVEAFLKIIKNKETLHIIEEEYAHGLKQIAKGSDIL